MTGEANREIALECLSASPPKAGASIEAESNGKLANGREYQNRYQFLFVVTGGKVKRITEYVDTLYAQRVLFE